MEISGAVCLITGASGGIGEALARELAANGAKVALMARRGDKAELIARELPDAIAIQGDVTKPEDNARAVAETVKAFGKLNVLVNNAGIGVVGTLDTIPPALLEEAWRTNVLGLVLAYQAAVPELRKTKGMVINISSGTSLFGAPTLGGYASTKAAVNLISTTMRNELKESGVRAMNVHPGFLNNDFMRNSKYADPQFETWASRANSAQRTSEDAARDIVQAMREDAEEFRAERR